MAKYTGPKCRLCRREGTKLFLKGVRCLSDKCAVSRRNQPPGPRSIRTRRGYSDYGRHLREKQKAKRIYGLLESQFRNYYEKAARKPGVTGQVLLQLLETRLDSIVLSAGYVDSRNTARQKIRQGKVMVNGKKITIPSYQVKAGDVIEYFGVDTMPKTESEIPVWMNWDADKKGMIIHTLPGRDDISYDINEQLIVEFYSR
jgi:small subunit ribosomal protein S4